MGRPDENQTSSNPPASDGETVPDGDGVAASEPAPSSDPGSAEHLKDDEGTEPPQDASEPPAEGEPSSPRSSNVTVLESGDRTFHIIGTAHVSRQSVEEVKEVIHELRPDTVCVELCQMRYETLIDPTRWQRLDIFQVIKQRKMLFLMASLALQAFQRQLGEKLGVRPGEELLAGVKAAEQVGAELVLADRDVQVTLRRTWGNLSFWNKLKLVSGLFTVMLSPPELSEEQVEQVKKGDEQADWMAEFAHWMPQVEEPLIDERDRYLMSCIEDAPGDEVVAVVGAAHVQGMLGYHGEPVDREALSKVPPKSRWVGLLKWLIPLIILVAFYFGYQEHAGEGLRRMIFAWVVPNAVFAGLLTLVAGGKLLSVLSAIIASPITSLNPTIGAGMVVGLVEAWLRRPTVQDCERLGTEVSTMRGLYRNPFSRILLVAIAASIGSSVGAWIGATWVLTLL